MEKITEKTRTKAIERFFKEAQKEYNKEKFTKGHTNNKKVYYINGYNVFTTDENIGVEILPQNESLHCERIFEVARERATKDLYISYNSICQYKKQCTLYKRAEKDDFRIMPLIVDNVKVWVNVDNLKMMMEITGCQEIRIQNSKEPITYIDKNNEIKGITAPVKGNDEIATQKYNYIINNF